MPAQRAGLGALAVDALQRLHLLLRVPHVLARVHLGRGGGTRGEPPLPARHHRHRRRRARLVVQERRGGGAAASSRARSCHGELVVGVLAWGGSGEWSEGEERQSSGLV